MFIFLYSFILPIVPLSNSLSTHSLKPPRLCLTFSQNSLKLNLSNSHISVSPLPTRLNPQCHRPPKLDATILPADPLHRTPKSLINLKPTLPIRLRPTPLINFSDALNFLKLTPLCPAATAADPRLWLDSPSSNLSLSSSSTCLGFLIWVCVCIYKYRINKF